MKNYAEYIGMNQNQTNELVEKLNKLLANYQVFYQNTRGFHWNIRGEKFFELHLKFEELYTNLQIKIDEIAERILTLGGTPHHSFSKYIDNSTIKAVENTTEALACVQSILDSLQVIISLQRDILEQSAKYNDEGTNALMSDYIRELEKLVWMYSSFLNN